MSLPLARPRWSPHCSGRGRMLGLPTAAGATPRRMLAVCNNLGLVPEYFFPKEKGRDYKPSPYLEMLAEHKNDFTVFSGVWHPDVDGGHPADNCFLTAAPHPGSGGFRNTISLDQFIAERLGHLTRFPSLTLGVNVQRGQRSLSWTGSGVLIPAARRRRPTSSAACSSRARPPRPRHRSARADLGEEASSTPVALGQARQLDRKVGPRDRDPARTVLHQRARASGNSG